MRILAGKLVGTPVGKGQDRAWSGRGRTPAGVVKLAVQEQGVTGTCRQSHCLRCQLRVVG